MNQFSIDVVFLLFLISLFKRFHKVNLYATRGHAAQSYQLICLTLCKVCETKKCKRTLATNRSFRNFDSAPGRAARVNSDALTTFDLNALLPVTAVTHDIITLH